MLKTIMLAVLLTLPFAAMAPADPVQDVAVAASLEWLKLVDSGDYAASWADAAKLFQDGINQDAWVKQVTVPRTQLGALKSRKFQSFQQMTSLPGVPDGDYAVVTFDSVFANRPAATELTTLVHEGDQWKVGGYFIK